MPGRRRAFRRPEAFHNPVVADPVVGEVSPCQVHVLRRNPHAPLVFPPEGDRDLVEILHRTGAEVVVHECGRAGLADALVEICEFQRIELDGVVVVEPSRIVSDVDQGLRALYVALTRSTQRLTVVHADGLPAPMH